MTSYQGSEQHQENARVAAKLASLVQTAKREQRMAAYNLNPRRCGGCQAPLSYDDVTKQKRKFCSRSCSAKVANARRLINGPYHSEVTKAKIREALEDHGRQAKNKRLDDAGMTLERSCKNCGTVYTPSRRIMKSICCSRKCLMAFNAKKFENMSEKDRKKASEKGKVNVQTQMEEGRWKGWSGRGAPSFPETFVMNLLENDGFTFDREKHCAGFSIDFAFESIMIALEVDGKQHDYPENAERDRRKEAALAKHGWTVVRLRWYSVRTKAGHQRVMEQYETIKAMLENLLKNSSLKRKKVVASVGESM